MCSALDEAVLRASPSCFGLDDNFDLDEAYTINSSCIGGKAQHRKHGEDFWQRCECRPTSWLSAYQRQKDLRRFRISVRAESPVPAAVDG